MFGRAANFQRNWYWYQLHRYSSSQHQFSSSLPMILWPFVLQCRNWDDPSLAAQMGAKADRRFFQLFTA